MACSLLLVVLSCAAWTWISFQFRYGEGHADRPILTFVLLYACAWTGFFLGYLQLRRKDRKAPLLLILATALVARFLLLPSGLIQENDVYRYVLDGQVLLAGENPYEQSPSELSLLPPEPLERALSDPAAKEVISRIGYADIPTLYPPAAQAAFAAGGLIGGWDWIGLRILFTLFDLALIGLIVLLLTRIGSPSSRVLLYAWNPLVLKEVTNSVHVDVLPAFFVVLLIVSLERIRGHGGWHWMLAAAGSLAGASSPSCTPSSCCRSRSDSSPWFRAGKRPSPSRRCLLPELSLGTCRSCPSAWTNSPTVSGATPSAGG